MLKQITTIGLLLFGFNSLAQLVPTNGQTAQQLGNNLAGSNISVTNASITAADSNQYGTFQYTGNDLGVNSGVILSTGSIFDGVGPNDSGGTSTSFGGPGDSLLSVLSGVQTNDAVVLEFDFEVQGDEIEFNYVFLSEEYNEFVGSNFNDVFAFYISGPGIVGQENLAVVPGTTTPVAINSINNNSFWQFYNDNTDSTVNIEFDGFTTLMTAQKSGLQQCGIYTLSLRIADGGDAAFDAAVMLQENSLVQSNISGSSSTFSSNNTALEGCIEANFTFQLDTISETDVTIPIGFGGTATNGVDYEQVDTLITIPAGQTSATIIIQAIADGITEGQEVIELYYTPTPCAPQDTVLLYIDDYIPLEYNISPTDISCFGAEDGQVDLTVSGGLLPYTLTLTDSATGTQTDYTTFPVTNLDVGTYYVSVIDGYGCTADDLVAGNLFDAGQTFLPDGTGASYTSDITLSGFPAGQTITSVNQIVSICATMEHSYANDLTIQLQAPNGATITLKNSGPIGGAINACNLGEPVASGPVDTWNATNTTAGNGYNYCWNANPTYATMSAIISATAPGPPPQYTYTTNAGNSYTDYYLPAGSYTPAEDFSAFIGAPLNGTWSLIITDNYAQDNGYIFDWSISLAADIPDSVFTIEQPEAPSISHTSTNPSCGASDGAIDITVTNGVAPLTYLWSNGEVTEDITGVSAGSFTVDVTDGEGCTHSYNVALSNNGSLVLTGNVTNESCAGQNNGAIDLTAAGGTAPITYSWDNGDATEDVSNLAPGNYTVTVNDGAGCQGVETFDITAGNTLNSSATVIDENCGDAEGIIDLTVFGAQEPITYAWSNGATTEDINELTQGTYSVTITDANGCTATNTFNVTNLVGNCVPDCDLAITNSTVMDENCGNGNGSINLTTFTTNGPAQYSWSNGATAQNLSNLSAGTYEVTITDIENCTVTGTYEITNETGGLAIIGTTSSNETCGDGQGTVNITMTGGAQPYSFNWSNGETTEDLSNLSAGTYSVNVTDANNCIVSTQATIENITTGIEITYGNAVNEVCGNGQGSIDIVVSGGTEPYTFLWTNDSITEDLTNLSAGTYTCTITDDSGCSITTQDFVVENEAGDLAINNIDVDNEICGNGLGEIELFISGGVAPLTYNWSNGETTQNIFNLSAGTFSATVSDASGCSVSTGDLTIVNESGTLSLDNVSVSNEACGNGLGAINLTVSGGTAPVSFNWNNGFVSEDISNLSAGTYECIISDANGCSITTTHVIQNEQGDLQIDNMIVTNDNCGQAIGAIDAIISGGTAPLTYSWDNGATTEDISNLTGGSYTLTVTDANGCSVSQTTSVTNVANGIAVSNVQVMNETCGNGAGSVSLDVTGGTAPLTYSWDNGATTEDLSNLSEGTYTLTITDASGCTFTTDAYNVGNFANGLTITQDNLQDENCGAGDGQIDVTISGGTAPYSYSWNSGQTTEDISGLSAGNLTLTVTDANGCSTSMDFTIENNAGSLAINPSVVNEQCGDGNGSINIETIGGTAPYTYVWSNGATTEDILGISAGTYSLTVTDASGCSVQSDDFIVSNGSGNLELVSISSGNEVCGNSAGFVDVNITGNVGTLNYTWSNGATTEDLSLVPAGVYTGTASDVNGCSIDFTATVGNESGTIQVTGITTDIACNAGNGAIDLTVTGGTDPNTYLWSNGATTEDLTNVIAGNYTCNITDANGCQTTYSATINDLGAVEIIDLTSTNPSCGEDNGMIQVIALGGTQPYTYNWNNLTGSSCCDYTISLGGGDWNGGSLDVVVNSNIVSTHSYDGSNQINDVFTVCNGDNIELNWSNGFTFNPEVVLTNSNGEVVFEQQGPLFGDNTIYNETANCPAPTFNENTASGLPSGDYSVEITDANGCAVTSSIVTLADPNPFTISEPTIVEETCGDQAGSISVTISPMTDLAISWSNGVEGTSQLNNVSAGTYTLTVTDTINNCVQTQAYEVAGTASEITITQEFVTDEFCGNGNGSINYIFDGVQGFPTFSWNNGETTQDLSNLSAGEYILTISDFSECDYIDTFVVENITNGLEMSGTSTNENCNDQSGSIDITVSNGDAPYTYTWNTGATSEDLNNLDNGTYTVVVTDATNCSVTETFEIEDNSDAPIITNSTIVNATCTSCDDGSIDITMSTANTYTYNWSNGETTQDITNLVPGNYTVTITSADGCETTQTFDIVSTASIDEIDKINLSVYPNPNNGIFNLNYSNLNVSEMELNVIDATGRIVKSSIENLDGSSGSIVVNLDHLEMGTYFLITKVGKQEIEHRIVILE